MATVLVDGIIYKLQAYGGISRYFTEIFSRLGNHHPDIKILLHVYGFCRGKRPAAPWIKELRDYKMRPQRIFENFSRSAGKLRSRAFMPKVFHSTYFTLPYWKNLKSVVTVHDFADEKFPALMGDKHEFISQKREAIEQADAIIAISNATKEDILTYTGVKESTISVIYHGVSEHFSTPISAEDIEWFKTINKIDAPYWLFVGLRRTYKNFGTMLRAFIEVAYNTDGCLVVAGGEPMFEPWEVDLLVRHRLANRVRMIPRIDDRSLRAAYAGSMAFVFPSLIEGFGLPLLEAMACGAPVLASDIPVFKEVAGDAALYFDPYSSEALKDAMIKIMDEPLRQHYTEKGFRRANTFSWDEAAQKTGDVYKTLLR